MIDKLMALKEWYLEWSASMESAAHEVEEIFTNELWDKFLLKRKEGAKQTREAKDNNGTEKVASKSDEGLNISYKVETKEIPTLPPNKSLKGKLFDEWHGNFYVKTHRQAGRQASKQSCRQAGK